MYEIVSRGGSGRWKEGRMVDRGKIERESTEEGDPQEIPG
jgi:hypothetical protein